jgi:Uri superfamily endonuclease
MDKYQKGKIYTIRCYEDNTLVYVGSTVQTLSKRIGAHRSDSKKEKYKNRILYKTVNNNWDNWYIELYENYSCNSKEELCKREGEIIREIGTLNKDIAGRTSKEYYQDNLDNISKYHKEYYQDNLDKILEKQKQYNKDNADNISKYHKQYYQDNADNISKNQKQYRQENADKILEKKAEKVICECGCEISRGCLSRHQKTKKHINQLKLIKLFF